MKKNKKKSETYVSEAFNTPITKRMAAVTFTSKNEGGQREHVVKVRIFASRKTY